MHSSLSVLPQPCSSPAGVSSQGALGEGRRAAGGRRCRSTLTLARAPRRPGAQCPFTRGPRNPGFFSESAHERGCRSLNGATGAYQSGLNCANRVSTPRAVARSPSLPLCASRPHIPKHSPLPFSLRQRPPEPGPRPAASERLPPEDAVQSPLQTAWPRHNTAARCTQSPPPRTGGAHGPEWGAPRSPGHLKLGAPLRRPAGPGAQPPPLPVLPYSRPPPTPAHSTQASSSSGSGSSP